MPAFLLIALLAAGWTVQRIWTSPPDTIKPLHYKISVTPDIASMRYTATESLRFEVSQPTTQVILQSVGLRIDSARLDGSRAAQIVFDASRERAIFSFDTKVAPGEHVLDLRFSAPIYGKDAQGVFKRTRLDANKQPRDTLFTMLCCLNLARYFAPMVDRIDAKAIFELDFTIAPGLDAVSNMPEANREVLSDGRTRVQFQPTPKMSPYLLFFAVGELERLSGKVGATDVGIVTQRGMSERAEFPLDTTMQVLGYFNEYLDYPFPLPKLDSVVISDARAFGGMENFGAISYDEARLLNDPRWSPPSTVRDTHELIAHEVAHQWFGDVVTPKSWDEIWLNEGFADWMSRKATQHLRPEWNMWVADAAQVRESAMRFDARRATYAIVPNHSFSETITYRKSGQVIRMLEALMGEEAFRTAIQGYLRAHAYGNASTKDLWRALERETSWPVVRIGRDFVLQKGVPLIDVLSTECAKDQSASHVVLRQSRFGLDAESKLPSDWHVPVAASRVGDGKVMRKVVQGARPVTLSVPGCGAIKVNAGETGYFRTRYDAASFERLRKRFGAMSAADQVGLLNDTFNLAEGGYGSFDRYLDLTAQVSASSDPLVRYQVVRTLRMLDDYFAGQSSQEEFRGYARRVLLSLFAPVGWTARPQEAANVSMLRSQLIEALGQLGDPGVLAEARRRFPLRQQDPAIVKVLGLNANERDFKALLKRARAAETLGAKDELFTAAASAINADIAGRALALTIDGTAPDELVTVILTTVAKRHHALALQFAKQHFGELRLKLDAEAQRSLIPAIETDRRVVREYWGIVRRERLPQVVAWIRRSAAYQPVVPPSMAKSAPVTQEDSSEAR